MGILVQGVQVAPTIFVYQKVLNPLTPKLFFYNEKNWKIVFNEVLGMGSVLNLFL